MKKLDRIERVVSHQSKSLLFINYPHRRVSKIERNRYMYIYRVSTCKYTKRSHHLLRRPKLDFKEIPRRFRTEDYVARQTCLEWIHGRGKYRNLDIYAGLYFDLFGSRDFSLRSRRGEAACNDIYIYTRLSGWANKVPYIGYDGGRCREHNAFPRSPLPRSSSAFFVNSPSYFAAFIMKTGRAPSILA